MVENSKKEKGSWWIETKITKSLQKIDKKYIVFYNREHFCETR